jgi:hypothetical protein
MKSPIDKVGISPFAQADLRMPTALFLAAALLLVGAGRGSSAEAPIKAAEKHPPAGLPSASNPSRASGPAAKPVPWMQDHLDSLGDRPLKRLVLPASHDSAMYQSGFPESLARTQDLTIYGQLSYGIRYFDLRPQWDDGKLFLHHGPVRGPRLAEVLDDVRQFASEGHRELVILKFSHYQAFHGEAYLSMAKQIKASLDPWLYTSLPRGRRLADITLAEYVERGCAVLVLCDGNEPRDHRREGIWVYRDWDSRDPEQGDLRVYDQYSNTMSYSSMKTDQFDKFHRYDGKCKYRREVPCDLFLLSWTLTPPTNVRGFSAEANRNLEAAIKELEIPNRSGCVANLLYTDYVDSARVTDVAIELNRRLDGNRCTHGKKL